MRLPWLLLAACGGHTVVPPKPAAASAPPAPTESFLERTSPHPRPRDVRHVDVKVARREGPDSLEWSLPNVARVARDCYVAHFRDAFTIHEVDYDDPPFTLTLDTRADGSVEGAEIEPPNTSSDVVMCLLQALAAQPLHLDKVPRHIVLTFRARIWWST